MRLSTEQGIQETCCTLFMKAVEYLRLSRIHNKLAALYLLRPLRTAGEVRKKRGSKLRQDKFGKWSINFLRYPIESVETERAGWEIEQQLLSLCRLFYRADRFERDGMRGWEIEQQLLAHGR